jgi:nicotinamide-nucleotide adenylyltransferase
MSEPLDRGLFVGRFQPFHLGHLQAIQMIRSGRPSERLLIGIGSAQESYTIQNPFTAGERFDMIDRALSEARIEGVSIVPLPDVHQHALWVPYVEGMLPSFHRVYTNNPLTRGLFEDAGYAVEGTPLFERERWVGVGVRAALARGESMDGLLPPAVARFLTEIAAEARMRLLSRPVESARRPEA